ncbi:hypothetical protein KXX11_003529, partial [Aspergillus fumigatus]
AVADGAGRGPGPRAGRRAGGVRRRPRLRVLVHAAPERPAAAGLPHAHRGTGQCRRVPRVRPVRLGPVALQRQLGGLHRPVRGGGKRRHRRPRPVEPAHGRLARRRRGAGPDRPPGACRRPALPLARSALAAHRIAPGRQAAGRGRLCPGQQHRPPRHRVAAGRGRHHHLRQGALRPDGSAPAPRDQPRDAGAGRGAGLQGGAVVPDRDDPGPGLRPGAARDPGDRGERRR